jgi:hypothetical protein
MKTAVEWLESEFVKLEHSIGVHHKMYELIEQAKEMEKQQIVLAYETAMETDVYNTPLKIGLDYYNETFKDK